MRTLCSHRTGGPNPFHPSLALASPSQPHCWLPSTWSQPTSLHTDPGALPASLLQPRRPGVRAASLYLGPCQLPLLGTLPALIYARAQLQPPELGNSHWAQPPSMPPSPSPSLPEAQGPSTCARREGYPDTCRAAPLECERRLRVCIHYKPVKNWLAQPWAGPGSARSRSTASGAGNLSLPSPRRCAQHPQLNGLPGISPRLLRPWPRRRPFATGSSSWGSSWS